jgi:hypothetical protein
VWPTYRADVSEQDVTPPPIWTLSVSSEVPFLERKRIRGGHESAEGGEGAVGLTASSRLGATLEVSTTNGGWFGCSLWPGAPLRIP